MPCSVDKQKPGAALAGDSWFPFQYSRIKQKSPDLPIETALLFRPTIIKRWCQPFGLHTRSLTNSFVCNFLSSSAGFNLCSCFFRLTLAFWLSLSGFSGPDLHTALRRYPVNFLTSAVFAPFRSLQFWILTTQPLLFLSFSSRFRLAAASPAPDSALASSVSPFSPA